MLMIRILRIVESRLVPLRRCDGSILMETALVLPILLALIAGAFEVGRLYLAQQKVSGLTTQTADMIAQAEFGISESEINDVFAAVEHISEPLAVKQNGRVIVSAVMGQSGGPDANAIVWQRCTGNLDADSDFGSEGTTDIELPGNITLAENEMSIVAETVLEYEPALFTGFFDPMELRGEATFRPRFGAMSTVSADASPSSC